MAGHMRNKAKNISRVKTSYISWLAALTIMLFFKENILRNTPLESKTLNSNI